MLGAAIGIELLPNTGNLVPTLPDELTPYLWAGLHPRSDKLGDVCARRLFGLVVIWCGALRFIVVLGLRWRILILGFIEGGELRLHDFGGLFGLVSTFAVTHGELIFDFLRGLCLSLGILGALLLDCGIAACDAN
jgi:hypothetical protein